MITTIIAVKIGATQYEHRRVRRFVPWLIKPKILDILETDLLEGFISLWAWSNGFHERIGMKQFALLNELFWGGGIPINPKSSFNVVGLVLPLLFPPSCYILAPEIE